MTTNLRRCAALFVFFGVAAFSQTTSVLVTAGYSEPASIPVSPGQVLTLFYRGIGPDANGNLRSGQAQAPLPTELAGLSAQIIQQSSLFNVRLLAVRQQPGTPI